jgi:hypothetical protein
MNGCIIISFKSNKLFFFVNFLKNNILEFNILLRFNIKNLIRKKLIMCKNFATKLHVLNKNIPKYKIFEYFLLNKLNFYTKFNCVLKNSIL